MYRYALNMPKDIDSQVIDTCLQQVDMNFVCMGAVAFIFNDRFDFSEVSTDRLSYSIQLMSNFVTGS
jgi:hypothetical protein